MKKRQVISFGTYVGKNGATRAYNPQAITTANLKEGGPSSGFGVFGYYTGKTNYPHTAANATKDQNPMVEANFMYNQKVYWSNADDAKNRVNGDANGAWVYTPVKYWRIAHFAG